LPVAAGLSEFNPGTDQPLWYVLLLLLLVGTPVSSVLARGEEYGWRGYLLPRLLPLGEVKASIILA
jgi:membrane protease YdiL (CAAX protease family)